MCPTRPFVIWVPIILHLDRCFHYNRILRPVKLRVLQNVLKQKTKKKHPRAYGKVGLEWTSPIFYNLKTSALTRDSLGELRGWEGAHFWGDGTGAGAYSLKWS